MLSSCIIIFPSFGSLVSPGGFCMMYSEPLLLCQYPFVYLWLLVCCNHRFDRVRSVIGSQRYYGCFEIIFKVPKWAFPQTNLRRYHQTWSFKAPLDFFILCPQSYSYSKIPLDRNIITRCLVLDIEQISALQNSSSESPHCTCSIAV